MKRSTVQSGPSDYIERPLSPKWDQVPPGSRDKEISGLETGLNLCTPIDGEDPRYTSTTNYDEEKKDDDGGIHPIYSY